MNTSMSKEVLIIGASGFVGGGIEKEVIRRGYKTAVLLRDLKKYKGPSRIILSPDFDNLSEISELFNSVFAVIYAAGAVCSKGGDNGICQKLYSDDIASVEKVACMARDNHIDQFIYISSVSVYGGSNKVNGKISIDSPLDPDTLYSQSKISIENRIQNIFSGSDTSYIVIRSPSIYGVGVQGLFYLLTILIRFRMPLPLSGIRNVRSFIYIKNLADFIISCILLRKTISGVYLISDDEDVSSSALCRIIANSCNRKAYFFYIPRFILSKISHIFGVLPLINSYQLDISKVKKDFNWVPPYHSHQALEITAKEIYNKQYIKRSTKAHAYNEKNEYSLGDKVRVVETKPFTKTKSVILLSNAHYTSIYRVGSHHLVNEFIKLDWNVRYVSSPISIFKLFDIVSVDNRKRIIEALFFKRSLIRHSAPICIVPFYRSKLFYFNGLRSILAKPINLRILWKKYDLILVDSPELLSILPFNIEAEIVYRPTDIYKNQSTELFNLEKKYIFSNNIPIICMSNNSYDFYSKYSNNVKGFVVNGVPSSFYKECINLHLKNKDKRLYTKKFVYVGAIDERLDFEWLISLVNISGVVLHIYGDGVRKSELLNNPILRKTYRGICKYSELPSVLTMYDIGLLPFSEDIKNISRSPMKLFEYVSAGLIVVSNKSIIDFSDIVNKIDIIKIKRIKSHLEIASFINIDLAKYNRSKLSIKAKSFLWSDIVKTVIKLIYDKH